MVAVGASAGGFGAFQKFLEKLPNDHSLAIVLVQHLDPDHDSLLPELLSKRTSTPVHLATDGMPVEPRNIYLIPPGQLLTIRDGRLRLEEFAKPRGIRRPIDKFFESLAVDVGSRAVAIVLSGTGSDGSMGVRAVKEHGGLVFVQDPEEAEYDGMPNSAIETGADDMVLPTSDMIAVISDYFSTRSGLEPGALSDNEFINRVAKHVHYRTGHDFRQYKQATLLRRLAVRMSVLGLTEPQAYLKELIANKQEASKLFRDLLINVTSFFRDPEAFDALRTEVIPRLVEGRGAADEIRVWVPGCSTGQEAFTIAILLIEELKRVDGTPSLAIFATDIDEDALRVARRGLYPNSIAEEVPQPYLDAYFSPTNEGFEVIKELRDVVRFSQQSMIKDPPFSRIDLVSCRNVTIYFEPELQDFTLQVFHYALKEGGYLFLGSSEMPREIDAFFSAVDQRHRIFARRPGPAKRLEFPSAAERPFRKFPTAWHDVEPEHEDGPHLPVLLGRFTPPYLLLDARSNVTFASEGAARYLAIKPGNMRTSLLQLILPELEPALRRLLVSGGVAGYQAGSQEFQGKIGEQRVRIVLSLVPLEDEGAMLVIEDRLDLVDGRAVVTEGTTTDVTYVRELETELDRARETVRSTVEELETSNEELKSSNEEMMSMNEELQSANEELSTTNEELQGKVVELREANQDMSNLMRATRLVTVFLDPTLKIRFFTPESTTVFRLRESDCGRSLTDIAGDVDIAALAERCERVNETGEKIEDEIQTLDGSRQFFVRVEPYTGRDESSRDLGIVVTLNDITSLRQAVREADAERIASQNRLAEIEQLYLVSPQAMALLDPDARYIRANRQMAEIAGVSIEDHIGRSLADMLPSLADQLMVHFRKAKRSGEAVVGARIEGTTSAHPETPRLFHTDVYPILSDDQVTAVGLNLYDVTEQTEMSAELRRVMRELQHRVKNMLSNVLALVARARRDADADVAVIDTLASRIKALSKTHKMLTEKNWRAAEIHALLEPELTEVYGADRVTLRGPGLTLNARAAVALGMATHELATNAAKYGAFSTNEGHVEFRWTRLDDGENERVEFVWTETGGPRTEPPDGKGFGTQLIESTVAGSLNGTVETEWRPEGLRCRLNIPYKELSQLADDVFSDAF